MPRVERTKDTRIVVVEVNEIIVGLVVDAVTEVLRIPEKAIEPPSPLMLSVDSAFIRGIGKVDGRLIILLDLNKVMVLQDLQPA
jgi:purine-binding chemotaxis protein CheW